MLVMMTMCHDGPSRHINTNTIDGENDDDSVLTCVLFQGVGSKMAAGTLTRSQNGAQQQPQYNPVGLEVIEMVVVMMVMGMMMKEVATVRPTTPI